MGLRMMVKRLWGRTEALANRLIERMIIESDLPVGQYKVVSSVQIRQLTRSGAPYSRKSIVKRDERKSWLVLSDSPLPDKFAVVADGPTNKVLRP